MLRTVAIAMLSSSLIAGAAYAQSTTTTTPGASSGAMKMTSAECTSVWNKIDSGKSGSVTQSQATTYVRDFKSADANSDGKLSSAEFQAACDKGMVRDTAASGSSTGSSGSGSMKK